MIYPAMPELLHIAERTLQGQVDVRDHGLLVATISDVLRDAIEPR